VYPDETGKKAKKKNNGYYWIPANLQL